MAVRSQRLDATGLTIVASDGRSITLTAAQVAANFASQTGTVPQRALATVAWTAGQIESALGAEQSPLAAIALTADATGLTSITTRSF